MMQVLDQYRKTYEKTTSTHCFEMPNEIKHLTVPTWEYVCWLEGLLNKNGILVESPPVGVTTFTDGSITLKGED